MLKGLVFRIAMYLASFFSFIGLYNLFFLGIVNNDSPEPWGIGFQDGVSPGYTGIVELHDNIFFYLVVIAILVFWMLGSTIYYFNYDKTKITHKYLVHGTLIEIIWTIFPAIILLGIAIPSFKLLYILDEVTFPSITLKATGHQWYWSYEYSDYETESGDPIEFDSYMTPDSDLEMGDTRLLQVDNQVVLPKDTHIRIIVTSTDVLHDFALPAGGIKMDATPGRGNQSSFYADREGLLYGQCSELCGTYHGFMPIQVEIVSVENYLNWISSLGIGLVLIKEKLQDTLREIKFFWNKLPNNIKNCLDAILIAVVLSYLLYDTLHIISLVLNRFTDWFMTNDLNVNEYVTYMTSDGNKGNTPAIVSTTHTQIIHDDGNWGSTIRQIFIHGAGGYRLWMLRSGPPGARVMVFGATTVAGLGTRVLENAINDPNYVKDHFSAWRSTVSNAGKGEVTIDVSNDPLTYQKLLAAHKASLPNPESLSNATQSTPTASSSEALSKFMPDGNDIENLGNNLLNRLIDILRPILEPVQVNYSNELLANQINGISILLFILTILIMVLITALLLNMLFLIYSDKLINYFNNKLIRGYLNFTKKFIALEVLVGGLTILYFMYYLSLGIRFIAIHPLTYS